MAIIQLLVIFIYASYGSQLEMYKQREQGYEQWLKDRETEKVQREAAKNEVRGQREKRELDRIRRRLQFRREIRSTLGNEAEHLAKLEKLEEKRLENKEAYAETQKKNRQYFERYLLPLKMKEYGLDQDVPTEKMKYKKEERTP